VGGVVRRPTAASRRRWCTRRRRRVGVTRRRPGLAPQEQRGRLNGSPPTPRTSGRAADTGKVGVEVARVGADVLVDASLRPKQQSWMRVCVQPFSSVQRSIVHASLSLQLGGVSGMQSAFSSQVAGLHVVPQGAPSRTVTGPQRNATQVPLLVQGLLSMSVQSTFV
jgi:hypothetical protein